MANTFVALPAPAANGSGAWVDVSTFGAEKTVTVVGNGGVFEPFVTIEFSNQVVPLNAVPLWTFSTPDERTFDVACRWMRATVSNYKGGGAPTVSVGSTDDGAVFAQLNVTSGDGTSAGVDVSVLPLFKTIQVAKAFRGVLNVEISEDGGATYNQVASFFGPGAQTLSFAADFMRVSRNGVPMVDPGLPEVWVAATQSGGGGGGASTGDLGWYGTGVDGDIVFDGEADVLGITPVANVYTLDKDLFPSNMTIDSGVTVNENGFRIYCAHTTTILDVGLLPGTGILENSGQDAAGTTPGAGGGTNSLAGGGDGAAVDTDGTPVGFWPSRGGAGGGGAGSAGGHPGGQSVLQDSWGTYMVGSMAIGDGVAGGPGGGGGLLGGGEFPVPGAGGGGGGVTHLSSKHIVAPAGSIRSTGGRGGDAVSGGGGGGGRGGVVIIITNDPVAPTCDVTGGLGGLGADGGADGDPGDLGTVIAISPLWGPL